MLFFFFFMNQKLIDFFDFINVINFTRNKNHIYLIYINNKIFTNPFATYNIDKTEEYLLAYFF